MNLPQTQSRLVTNDSTKMPSLRVLATAAQHIGDRKEQQDRLAVYSSASAPKCALAVLADGLGGRSGGAIASESVLFTAKRLFDEFTDDVDPRIFLRSLIHEAHASIRAAAFASRLEPHSTLVALLIQPHRIDWCHVGDSRLYVYRHGAEAHQTLDHTVAMSMVLDGKLTPERARLHPSAGKLSQALGAASEPVGEFGGFADAQAGDRFILCSDGLWSYFQPDELKYLVHNTSGQSRTRLLIDEARTRAGGKGDNCSLCVIELAS
jgi:PPM family protein phosphatase